MKDIQNSPKANGGHSATVQMWLHIEGKSLAIVQAGDKALKLQEHVTVPTGPASLEIVVDGQSRCSAVNLLANMKSRWIQIIVDGNMT